MKALARRRRADHGRRRARARTARRLDQQRVGKARPLEALADPAASAVASGTTNWVIAAYPTAGQAEQMFGEPDVERLWEAVAYAVRLDEPTRSRPGASTSSKLQRAVPRSWTSCAFDAIRFSGPGTDLTIGLLPGARWIGGGVETQSGDLPRRRTCRPRRSSPPRTGGATEGTVRSTRPLALGGTVVRDLEFRFEGGAIVEVRPRPAPTPCAAQLDIDEFAQAPRRSRARRRHVARRQDGDDVLRHAVRRERDVPHRLRHRRPLRHRRARRASARTSCASAGSTSRSSTRTS